MGVLGPASPRAASTCVLDERAVYHFGRWHEALVYDRLALDRGEIVAGPCLLEQPDTTIFIDPGQRGRVDDWWNLVIESVS